MLQRRRLRETNRGKSSFFLFPFFLFPRSFSLSLFSLIYCVRRYEPSAVGLSITNLVYEVTRVKVLRGREKESVFFPPFAIGPKMESLLSPGCLPSLRRSSKRQHNRRERRKGELSKGLSNERTIGAFIIPLHSTSFILIQFYDKQQQKGRTHSNGRRIYLSAHKAWLIDHERERGGYIDA